MTEDDLLALIEGELAPERLPVVEAALRADPALVERVVEELIKLLQERDLETLSLTYRTLFGRIVEPGADVLRAFELIDAHCSGQ